MRCGEYLLCLRMDCVCSFLIIIVASDLSIPTCQLLE